MRFKWLHHDIGGPQIKCRTSFSVESCAVITMTGTSSSSLLRDILCHNLPQIVHDRHHNVTRRTTAIVSLYWLSSINPCSLRFQLPEDCIPAQIKTEEWHGLPPCHPQSKVCSDSCVVPPENGSARTKFPVAEPNNSSVYG